MGAVLDTFAPVYQEVAPSVRRHTVPGPSAHADSHVRDGIQPCAEADALGVMFNSLLLAAGSEQAALFNEISGLFPGDALGGASTLRDFAAGARDGASLLPTRAEVEAGAERRAAKQPYRDGPTLQHPNSLHSLAGASVDSASPFGALPATLPVIPQDATPAALVSLLSPSLAEVTLRSDFLQRAHAAVSAPTQAGGRRTAAPAVVEPVQSHIAAAAATAAREVARARALLQGLVLHPDDAGSGSSTLAPSERRNGTLQLLRNLSVSAAPLTASQSLRELPAVPRAPKLPRHDGAPSATAVSGSLPLLVAAAAAATDAAAEFAAAALSPLASPPAPVATAPAGATAGAVALVADLLARLERINDAVAASQCLGAPRAVWWGITAIV